MKSIRNLLPALGLVFGATLAMAMNFPIDPTERYAKDPSSPTWYNLTGITPGPSTYQCNASSNICSHEDPMSSAPEVEDGTFVKRGSLPVANL